MKLDLTKPGEARMSLDDCPSSEEKTSLLQRTSHWLVQTKLSQETCELWFADSAPWISISKKFPLKSLFKQQEDVTIEDGLLLLELSCPVMPLLLVLRLEFLLYKEQISLDTLIVYVHVQFAWPLFLQPFSSYSKKIQMPLSAVKKEMWKKLIVEPEIYIFLLRILCSGNNQITYAALYQPLNGSFL